MAVDYEFPTSESQLASARADPAVYVALGDALADAALPMTERFRALFTLKALKTDAAVAAIGRGFDDPSSLLKHEVAYVLGQMKLVAAIPVLSHVLADRSEDPMVRHEAAEALGAIGDRSVLPLLERYQHDATDHEVVRQTCELAVDLLRYDATTEPSQHGDDAQTVSAYASVDPAPPLPARDVAYLRTMLLDSSLPLFKRYRAMFTLRNIGTEPAVLALADGFADTSALFRHEIAYVFGQLQHPASVPSLRLVLSDPNEEGMVRHEAAEALGSIATPECLPLLQQFTADADTVVRESCEVGVDMWEYENSGDLQYANGLPAVTTTI
ncbi:hypothetical protein BC828DRAFT_387481 [Blastocladiella britannica]|nr:hypothetical protein BC828DRAFT_387481 [Blastocladiella britannica]